MQFKVEEITSPFWAKESTQSSGRDPLAIQNSSVVIYTRMMTGITNVTNRLRYIGFFCWCFEQYLTENSGRYSHKDQFFHLRRAELLMAYLMVEHFSEELGVSGTNLARSASGNLVDLSRGADLDRRSDDNKMYWQFPQGIFGQYFSGVMREFGLIRHPDDDVNLYSLTEKGIELAGLFEHAIGKQASKFFWSVVKEGHIPKVELIKLIPLSLNGIAAGSLENTFYINMLMDQDSAMDEKCYHRRETILLLLNFVKHKSAPVMRLTKIFLAENYYAVLSLPRQNADARSFWALYEITEIFHLSLEHFHACLLWSLSSSPKILTSVLGSLIDKASKTWKDSGTDILSVTITDILQNDELNTNSVHDLNHQMTENMKERNFGEVLKFSLLSMLKVLQDIRVHRSAFQELASRREYYFNRPGNLFDLLDSVIESQLNERVSAFYERTFLLVINMHTYSSYAKSRIGLGQAHNYMIEEDMIWSIRDTSPNRTSPRLQNTVQFMLDVGWLERNGELINTTYSGKEQLNIYGH